PARLRDEEPKQRAVLRSEARGYLEHVGMRLIADGSKGMARADPVAHRADALFKGRMAADRFDRDEELPRLARDALEVIVPFALRQLHVRSVPDSRAPENSILDLLRSKIGQRRVHRPGG